MSLEFTGERVVAGQVDQDLWNEHYSRYAFASRFCHNATVLDAGCGEGYGSKLLSSDAKRVVGIDLSREAITHAAAAYRSDKLRWLTASCAQLPFADATFDTVVAFEVIEHLTDWPDLLKETRRVLTSSGVLLVSTPNKTIYEETRGDAGPNPFHEHEFEYSEFREALGGVFAHVRIVLQNHAGAVAFESEAGGGHSAAEFQARSNPLKSNFFIALCSQQPVESASFVYVPKAARPLRHGAARLAELESEVDQKNKWLAEAQEKHIELIKLHDAQTAQLQEHNTWAADLDRKLTQAGERIVALQQELRAEQQAGLSVAEHYKRELESCTKLAQETDARLSAELEYQVKELGKCVALLDKAEATVTERTEWALKLQRDLEGAQSQLAMIRASRWLKLGRAIGMGPELSG